jgi:hypothetical protein
MKYFLLACLLYSCNIFAFGFKFIGLNNKTNVVDYFQDKSGIMLYQFDNNVLDIGSTFTGTLVHTPESYDVGKVNNSISLGDYQGLLIPRLIDNATAASFSFWVNPQSNANAIMFFGIPQDYLNWNNSNQRGFYFSYQFANQDFGDGLNPPANAFHIYNSGNQNADIAENLSSTAITKGVWNHVVFSFSAPTMKIYVNGVLQGSVSNSAWTVLRSFQTSSQGTKWIMGDSAYTSNLNTALFDQVRAFNRSLTDSEVLRLYNNP